MANKELLKKAVEAFDALSPEQKAAMLEEQRQSWVRGNVGLSRDERGITTPIMPKNTRPAAPVEGFRRLSLVRGGGLEDSKDGDYVRFDQAEALIAAKDARIEDLEQGRAEFADHYIKENETLTARVEGLETERDEAIRRGEDQWAGWVKEEALRKALEIQLTAVRKSLEPFAAVLDDYDPVNEHDLTPGTLVIGSVTNYEITLGDLRKASATLEAKP